LDKNYKIESIVLRSNDSLMSEYALYVVITGVAFFFIKFYCFIILLLLGVRFMSRTIRIDFLPDSIDFTYFFLGIKFKRKLKVNLIKSVVVDISPKGYTHSDNLILITLLNDKRKIIGFGKIQPDVLDRIIDNFKKVTSDVFLKK
jgi:hypothetical protein